MTKRSSPRRPRFLDPAKIDEAIAEIGILSKKEDLRVALVGGAALQLYGSDRFTADVDFAASGYPAPDGPLRARGALTFGGILTTAPNGVPVDIIVRDDQYADLYEETIDNAGRMTGVPVPVATLPYLGAMKLASGRGKDLQDLRFILLDSGVSYKKLRAVVVEHLGVYAGDKLDAIKQTSPLERGSAKKGSHR